MIKPLNTVKTALLCAYVTSMSIATNELYDETSISFWLVGLFLSLTFWVAYVAADIEQSKND